jgi:hypothetical protein
MGTTTRSMCSPSSRCCSGSSSPSFSSTSTVTIYVELALRRVLGLEERKGGRKAGSARDKSRPMHHTCMLAFVNPGSLTIVGLQSTT